MGGHTAGDETTMGDSMITFMDVVSNGHMFHPSAHDRIIPGRFVLRRWLIRAYSVVCSIFIGVILVVFQSVNSDARPLNRTGPVICRGTVGHLPVRPCVDEN